MRQGNQNPEVAIYRYVTEGSFDAYMWQALETKARFISQIMTGDSNVRRADDIGGQELSYAEVKAIASGNPAVLTLAEADAELQRLSILRKNHADDQFLIRRKLKELPATIDRLTRRLELLQQDQDTLSANALSPMKIGDRVVLKDNIAVQLGERLERLPEHVNQATRLNLGEYQGLRFGIQLFPNSVREVFLESTMTRATPLSRDHAGPRAILNALTRLAGTYQEHCDKTAQELALTEQQLHDYQARLGQPFLQVVYCTELTQLRDQLRTALADKTSPANEALHVSAGELSIKIKDFSKQPYCCRHDEPQQREASIHSRGAGDHADSPELRCTSNQRPHQR